MSTQQDNLTEIANAIRHKDGSVPLIVATNFASRIGDLKPPVWEYEAGYPNPEQLYLNAVADANDASLTGGYVVFFDIAQESYNFAYVKYLYGSDGQKITAGGGNSIKAITFDRDSYITLDSGRGIRWVVCLQSYGSVTNTSYVGGATYLSTSAINYYIPKDQNVLYTPTYHFQSGNTYKHAFESIVFGRDNTDGQNYFWVGGTTPYLFQNMTSFFGIVNGKLKINEGTNVSMINSYVNTINMVQSPGYMPMIDCRAYNNTNLYNGSYGPRGHVEIPVGYYTGDQNWQNFFMNCQGDFLDFVGIRNDQTEIKTTTLTYALRYAINLREINCEGKTLYWRCNANAIYFLEYATALRRIEPILDCTGMTGTSTISILNNAPGTQYVPYVIKHIRMILSPNYSVNLTYTMHSADTDSWQFLVDNAPDVTASPKTLTIGADLIAAIGGAGGAMITALNAKGWVVA